MAMTPSGVRQHLAVLARDGLVRHREQREGPGRPKHYYALTPVAEGCAVEAQVSIDPPNSRLGRLLGRTTGLMLAAGTLDVALSRIAREAERSARPGRHGRRS